jgi:hypothetical protein
VPALSRAQLEAKFDALYAAADQAMQDHDPCAVRGGQCYSMREFPQLHDQMPFCCGGCRHLGPQGCTVESLHCRLWVCGPVDWTNIEKKAGRESVSPLIRKLRRLTAIADRYGFRIWRGTKAESIEQALRKQAHWKNRTPK